MSLDENIRNAFEVVRKTYENVEKMMFYLDEKALENEYEPAMPRYLRYRSDVYIWGWMCNELIKIYQAEEDPILPSEWKDGLIYTVGFDFYEMPLLVVSAFSFEMDQWVKGISPADIWLFSDPLDSGDEERFEHTPMEKNVFQLVKPRNSGVADRYAGFNYAIYREYNISEITAENLSKKVFDEFEIMKKIKIL